MSYPHGTSLHFTTTANSHLHTLRNLTPTSLPHLPALMHDFCNNLARAREFFHELKTETLHASDHFQLAKVGDEVYYTAVEFVRTVERMMGDIVSDELEVDVFDAVEEVDRKMLRLRSAVDHMLRVGYRRGDRVVSNGEEEEEEDEGDKEDMEE